MLAFIVFAALQAAGPKLGGDLSPGLQLHYSSGEQASSPWIVDSVDIGAALRTGADCARFTLRRGSDAPPNESRLCVVRDTLFGWDARANAWTAQRPVGRRMVFVQPRANRDTVRYTTDTVSYEIISDVRLPVLLTTVLTVDSLGRPKRRLRERYAVTLATATGGSFEVPDGAGGWRPEQTFELRRLVRRTR